MVRTSKPGEADGFVRVSAPSRRSLRRLSNLARRRVSFEATHQEIEPFGADEYEEIFCGGVELYRATRAVFPDQHLTVRLHNLFSLVQSRRRARRYPVDPVFAINLATYPALERRIFLDPSVSLVFATEAEQAYHRLHFPECPSEIWAINTVPNREVRVPTKPRLIGFGGVSFHKAAALRYFISEVFRVVRRRHPEFELHLHGQGTSSLDDPARGVYGHGRFSGSGIPHDGNGLFVNPDLLGGGIKVKVGDWLEWEVPFISTSFGVDGYSFERSTHRIVEPIERWPAAISEYFNGLGLVG